MRLLYISSYQFAEKDGITYALPAYGDKFWEKYLDVFDSIHVLGERVKGYLNNGTLAPISNSKVSVDIILGNTNPKDFINDRVIKKKLKMEIEKAEAILIKPSSRKGMMAIKIAKKLKKPYMVELTGDLRLTLSIHRNPLKRLYGPIIHNQIVHTIKNAPFGLYVTEKYLQEVYPISGEQCGASDVYISDVETESLEKRIKKIGALNRQKVVNIGLIGAYHDDRKGIDTAIKAVSRVRPRWKGVQLNILALGIEEDRQKWLKYAREYGVEDCVKFPPSCDTTKKVLEWIDTQDIIILPSRSEGLPRCIVEAMSRGCPCITSDVCGMPELINKKWLHQPNDDSMLASLIVCMLEEEGAMLDAARENHENSFRFLREKIDVRRNEFLTRFRTYCQNNKENG